MSSPANRPQSDQKYGGYIYKHVSSRKEVEQTQRGGPGEMKKKKEYKVTTEISIRRKKKREKVVKKLTNLHSR